MKCEGAEFIDLSKDILQRGGVLRFQARGGSMYPLIRDGDIVLAKPADVYRIRYGDIIFYRGRNGKPVVHRVIRIGTEGGAMHLATKGDAADDLDEGIEPDNVIGKVVAIEKDIVTLKIDGRVSGAASAFYAGLLPFSKWIFLIVYGLFRLGRRPKKSIESFGDVLEKEAERYKTSAKNALMSEGAKKILNSLNERGVKTMPLKGIFLAEHVYNNGSMRPMSDIDILVMRSDLAKAHEQLMSLGYVEPPYYKDVLENDRISSVNSILYNPEGPYRPAVHVHWHIINGTWPLEPLVAQIDMNRIWSCAKPATVSGARTYLMSPEHLIIYLAHHGLQHSFDKASMISDITETMRRYDADIDWERVRVDAAEFGMLPVIYYALMFVAKASGCAIPFEMLEPAETSLLDRMIRSFILKRRCCYRISYAVYMTLQKGVLAKAGYLFKTLFPSRIVLADNLRLPANKINPSHYYKRLIGARF